MKSLSAVLLLLMAQAAAAQPLDESAIEGSYVFKTLQLSGDPRTGARFSTAQRAIVFDGAGSYVAGEQPGRYRVDPSGRMELASPLDGVSTINARIGSEGLALVGSSTETTGRADLWVAVKTTGPPPPLAGSYFGTALLFRDGAVSAASSSLITFDAEEIAFDWQGDGTGTATFPAPTPFPADVFDVAVGDGTSILIGAPVDPLYPGMFFAVPASEEFPTGLLWIAELVVENGNPSSSVGSLFVQDSLLARLSQRWNSPRGAYDFRGVRQIVSRPGAFTSLGATQVAASPAGVVGTASAPPLHSILLALPAVWPMGTPAADPNGLVSSASFSPSGDPVAPRQLVSLFGTDLAPGLAVAQEQPLPTTLAGVSVEISGTAAPLVFVSPSQVNFQIPDDYEGQQAAFVLKNNGTDSPPITPHVSRTAPAIFYVRADANEEGIFTHADFSLITAQSPAAKGEIIVAFATGLGDRQPPTRVLVGGESAEVLYAGPAPSFQGLDQINLRVSQSSPAGDGVPVTLWTKQGFTDTVTIAIAP